RGVDRALEAGAIARDRGAIVGGEVGRIAHVLDDVDDRSGGEERAGERVVTLGRSGRGGGALALVEKTGEAPLVLGARREHPGGRRVAAAAEARSGGEAAHRADPLRHVGGAGAQRDAEAAGGEPAAIRRIEEVV